jgi:hypothetical protein
MLYVTKLFSEGIDFAAGSEFGIAIGVSNGKMEVIIPIDEASALRLVQLFKGDAVKGTPPIPDSPMEAAPQRQEISNDYSDENTGAGSI